MFMKRELMDNSYDSYMGKTGRVNVRNVYR